MHQAPGSRNQSHEASISLLGVRVDAISLENLLSERYAATINRHHTLIVNVNIYALNLAYEIPWFRTFLNSADLVFCDGAGVILAARLFGYCLPERITYADWTRNLAKFAAEHELSLYFLGGKPGVADHAAKRLIEEFPQLKILGTANGYFDKSLECPENQAVICRINAVKPDILIVGFGMPLQERWLMDNWAEINASVGLPAGAVFDYISGQVPRAPRWMTDHGLEWLGRLAIEPRRLWKRYLIGNPLFFLRVLRQRLGGLHLD
jgi:N-acetylglucosaminyldiphosphoundecaprenol N-acetyl-beta-D-mannosaminyltransferase